MRYNPERDIWMCLECQAEYRGDSPAQCPGCRMPRVDAFDFAETLDLPVKAIVNGKRCILVDAPDSDGWQLTALAVDSGDGILMGVGYSDIIEFSDGQKVAIKGSME